MTAERTTNGHSTIALREIGRWTGGGTPSKSNAKFWINGTIPWVSPKDMKVLRLKETEDHITDDAVANSATNIVRKGSVLIVVRSGILRHSLPVAVADRDVALNQDLKAVELTEAFDPDYVAWALRAAARDILHTCAKAGTTVQNLEIPRFLNYRIRSAPLEEQQRIVAEIEKQFTRLDAGLASLKRIQTALKRYHASVLKAACDGRLAPTEAELARKENRRYETADKPVGVGSLSIESKSNRRRAGRLWGAGHVPDLTDEERAGLPVGWTWAKVRDLGTDSDNAVQVGPMSMQSKDFTEDGVPVLNVGCVRWGYFDESKLNHLPKNIASKFDRYRVRAGDVLFTRSGTVGRCAVAQPHQEGWLMTFHLLRARPDPSKCLPQFLRVVFEGALHIRRQTKAASVGSTRAGFNTRLLADLAVPLPPLVEQHRIIAEVERRSSLITELQAAVGASTQHASALRRSILCRVFADPTNI
jgi:Restriction endonuclease S subunits